MLSIQTNHRCWLTSMAPVLCCVKTTALVAVVFSLLWGCAEGDVEPEVSVADVLSPDGTGDGDVPDYTGGVEIPAWSETPPAARSETEVCQAWADAQPTALTVVISSTEECAAGELTDDARRDALYRLNFYRWLVGLPMVTEATPFLEGLQQCAAYQGRNEIPITHDPPTDLACYTDSALEYANKSNLAAGLSRPMDGVDLFIGDVGHRSLLLAPGLGATAIGYFGGVLCQLMFDENWTWNPPVHRTIAYPGPGPNPQSPTRVVTIHPATGHIYDSETRVQVVQAGVEVTPSVQAMETGYGTTMLVIELDRTPEPGERVEISVEDIATQAGRTRESYTWWFTSCP